MSYSKDYKKRAVEYKDEGHTFKELREVFKIPAITYYDRKEKIGNGCYEKKDKLRRKRVIDREKLAEAVKEQPDAYLYELADLFGCTPQAVFYALKEMKITLKKKTFSYAEKSDEARAEYSEKLSEIPEEKVVYVDECGVDKYLQREYARAERGEPVYDTKPGQRYQRTNVVAGLCNGNHLAVECYGHSTNAAFFEKWFEVHLLKEVPPGYTIVMDNARFHRKSQLEAIAKKAGVNLLFLPPYSPDLNPIEKSWANLKRWLRDLLSCFLFFHLALADFFF